LVPDFDKAALARLPAAAIRYVWSDERIQVLVIGMRSQKEIDANLATLAGEPTCTPQDRGLLAAFSARALATGEMRRMRLE